MSRPGERETTVEIGHLDVQITGGLKHTEIMFKWSRFHSKIFIEVLIGI